MTVLVDTNVLSELSKPRPAERVVRWLADQRGVHLSVVSLMEMEFGVARASGANQARLRDWLDRLMLSPDHVIVDIDRTIARVAANMKATAYKLGKPRPLADLWIAATAQVLNATLVTRNTTDFEYLNLPLFNPFGDSAAAE